jgi:plasmid stabilization system protein ParE
VVEEAQGVKWAYAARADLLEILEYLTEESPAAAESFLNEVETAAASLTQFPQRGALVRELNIPNLRQIFVGRYRLIYRVEKGGVGIARLIHGRRDLRNAWRKRAP